MPRHPTTHFFDLSAFTTRTEQRRKQLGLTMADVSVAAGLKPGAYRDMIARGKIPSLASSIGYAKALECSLDALLGIADTNDGILLPKQKKEAELREQIEEVIDLLHAIDKIGDGIGGQDGFAVSVVALNTKSIADNALAMLRLLAVEAEA